RPLVLGGLRIDHPRGLVGHSDADVVLHALTDALLGAAGLGDIGDAYPDTDPAYKDRDSAFFLRETLARLNHAGWRVVNTDLTISTTSCPTASTTPSRVRRKTSNLSRPARSACTSAVRPSTRQATSATWSARSSSTRSSVISRTPATRSRGSSTSPTSTTS